MDLPKPAALHLYPHIHSTKSLSGSGITSSDNNMAAKLGAAAHVAASGSLSAAHYKSLLQPQLYNLHSNPLNAQSQMVKAQLDKVCVASVAFVCISPYAMHHGLRACVICMYACVDIYHVCK